MWGKNRAQNRPDHHIHASYADPRASLLLRCVEQSPWTETVRIAATAEKTLQWLAHRSDIKLEGASPYTADWRAGTAHFRLQVLEVPPLKNAGPWNLSRRWRKQPHRLVIVCLLSVDSDRRQGWLQVSQYVRDLAATLDGENRTIDGVSSDAWKPALKSELKVAHAVPLVGVDAAHPVEPPKSAEDAALEAELTSVPMSSAEKPDINGWREEQRVRLVNAFDDGETTQYGIGREGTVLVPDTSPAHIRMCRDGDLHTVLMDNGGSIMTAGTNLERIPGRAEVVYSMDGERVRIER
ncbi:hypothetical protein OG496_28405 [Streptomyces sp. NBC_00988]|uniref:hypothetical protein n=1 Tax=Streptomyces sp. NBC_00988 TaxID=2903704 RepID=UPI0038698506|nr:hypothetical protein OG496_28405 [Streptomyces sp. NBC_00988]